MEVGLDVDLFPVQDCREAQDEPGSSGWRLSERSEFAPRRLIRASQGTRRARMSGALSFGYFSLGKDKSVWNRFEQPQAGP